MQITGIGTDIAEISRLTAALERGGRDFCQLVFTPAEIDRAEQFRKKAAYFACCWAAKEAFAKALGCGIGEFCRLSEVEVTVFPAAITLSGAALATFERNGGTKIHLAVAAERRYAVATVIICS